MNVLLNEKEASATALMERVLRDGQEIAGEYPLVFEENFPGRILALGEGDEVRSACTILARDFVVPGGVVRGGMIGCVSTDPAWQSKGLGTHILVEAEAALAQEGCVFGMLWADDAQFYLSRGYCPLGVEEDVVLTHDLAAKLPEATGVREMTEEDARAIHRLYLTHTVRVTRSAEETRALLTCPSMRTLVCERDGQLTGYACLGRGHDLTGAIHEWGGRTDDVLAVVRAHIEHELDPAEDRVLVLISPSTNEELGSRLAELGAQHQRGILGLGKILDQSEAARLLSAHLAPLGSVELVETNVGPRFHLTGPENEGYLDDDAALALLFPTDEVRPEVEKLLSNFGLSDVRLPIEPFVWGLDSI